MRLAAVTTLAGMVVLSAGNAALAADAVSGKVTAGQPTTKVANTKVAEGEQTTIVSPLTFTPTDGDSTPVYCVAFTADLSDGTYKEGPAKGSGVDNYYEISWLLAHSYPAVSAES